MSKKRRKRTSSNQYINPELIFAIVQSDEIQDELTEKCRNIMRNISRHFAEALTDKNTCVSAYWYANENAVPSIYGHEFRQLDIVETGEECSEILEEELYSLLTVLVENGGDVFIEIIHLKTNAAMLHGYTCRNDVLSVYSEDTLRDRTTNPDGADLSYAVYSPQQ